jgi:hypothetical protein
MYFTISFAFSTAIPFLMVTTWRTDPFAAGWMAPYSMAFNETPRFTSFV